MEGCPPNLGHRQFGSVFKHLPVKDLQFRQVERDTPTARPRHSCGPQRRITRKLAISPSDRIIPSCLYRCDSRRFIWMGQ